MIDTRLCHLESTLVFKHKDPGTLVSSYLLPQLSHVVSLWVTFVKWVFVCVISELLKVHSEGFVVLNKVRYRQIHTYSPVQSRADTCFWVGPVQWWCAGLTGQMVAGQTWRWLSWKHKQHFKSWRQRSVKLGFMLDIWVGCGAACACARQRNTAH